MTVVQPPPGASSLVAPQPTSPSGYGPESIAAGTFPTPGIWFPNDYLNIDHFVTFNVLKFESVTRTSTLSSDAPLVGGRTQIASRLVTSVTLPMPGALLTNYGVNYDETPIGALGEIVATASSNVGGSNAESFARQLGQTINPAEYARAFGGQTTGQGVSQALQRLQNNLAAVLGNLGVSSGTVAAATASAAAGALARLTPASTAVLANMAGVARNPHKVVLFGGVNFRTHTFTYSLTPRNAREAFNIKEILRTFKYYMSPSYGVGGLPGIARGLFTGLGFPELGQTANSITAEAGATSRAFFEYPEVFLINFRNRGELFQIGESVLTDFGVNYHPQNYPAYVRSLDSPNIASPSEVVISLTFKETDIVTKEQIKENNR
jgi:hypothetical protein